MSHRNRDENRIVHEMLNFSTTERQCQDLLIAMQSGYEAMGDINLEYAESIQENDLNQLELYESSLAQGRD